MKLLKNNGGLHTLLFFLLIVSMHGFDSFGRSSNSSKVDSGRNKVVTTFEKPDFAFPQDVRKDALVVYEQAMREGNPEKALLAAMQLNLADNITSRDSTAVVLRRFAAIEQKFSSPWSNVAALLQARCLSEEYHEDFWNYDRRELPLDELDPNPLLWSGAQFRKQIAMLCERSVNEFSFLGHTNLLEIKALLTNLPADNPDRYSVADFIVDKVTDIYRSSRIGENDGPAAKQITPSLLLTRLIAEDEANLTPQEKSAGGTLALLQARLTNLDFAKSVEVSNDTSLARGYVKTLLEEYPEGSPMRGQLICCLYENGAFNITSLSSKRELYELVTSCAKDSSGKVRKYLEWIGKKLTQPTYELSTPGQWLPAGDTITLKVRNIANGHLLMVPVSARQAEGDRIYNKNLTAIGKIREICHVSQDATKPTEEELKLAVSNIEPGYYALVMSKNKELSGIYESTLNSRPDFLLVSSLACFTSNDAHRKLADATDKSSLNYGDVYLYVVNGTDNTPVKGAEVWFYNTQYNYRDEKKQLITDSDGRIKLPFDHCKAVITHGSDRLLWTGDKSYVPGQQKTILKANIFTDLALYHPGDTIQIATVVTESDGRQVKVAPYQELTIKLFDANGNEVRKTEITADAHGRATCSLEIPSEGLTGSFGIQVEKVGSRNSIGYSSVEVAEYKAPTFRVILDDPKVENGQPLDLSAGASVENNAGGKILNLTGSVVTYSGVPLADAEVKVSVIYNPWFSRWWRPTTTYVTEFGATGVTDATGRYSVKITIPSEDSDAYDFGRFVASAEATSPAGESQMSNSCQFAIGEGYQLVCDSPMILEVTSDEVKIPVGVEDILGHPVQKEVEYSLVRLDYEGNEEIEKIEDGTFRSPALTLKSSSLPSGSYRLTLRLPEALSISEGGQVKWKEDTESVNLIIWRADDKRPPMATPLWVPKNTFYASPGQKEVEVTVGAGYSGEWVYMEMADRNGTLRREWLRPQGSNIKVKVPVPADGELICLNFEGCHNLDQKGGSVMVYPPAASRKTEFRVETFRDRLVPGSMETWRFRLMSGWPGDKDEKAEMTGPLRNAAVMAVMTNEALDALRPFNWTFNPQSRINYSISAAMGGINYPFRRTTRGDEQLLRIDGMRNPVIFSYPQFLYLDQVARPMMYRKLYVRGASVAMADGMDEMEYESAPVENLMAKKMEAPAGGVLEESVVTDDAVSLIDEEGADNAATDEMVSYRALEMPLAFFKPLLLTDNEGNVDVEFRVPDFNTTWVLQILGYDNDANAAVSRMTARASKPVMVTTHTPRFLLTGDHAEISATMLNASDESLDIEGSIEIFDIVTGTVIARRQLQSVVLEANGSTILTVGFDVPSDMNQIGVRAMVQSEKGSDGEQGVVQVLPSSTPVMDATTFYLTPGQKECSVTLPSMNSSGNVTLNFCANPYWYVLTALSGALNPDGESALEQVVALYSTAVSAGLIEKNPKLREGLRLALDDDDDSSSLTLSPLSKNQSLKITTLNNTPWVNNSETETMRISGLDFLLDRESTVKAIRKAIDGLDKTRNPNGAWSWMKGMPSSQWITEQVLSALGRMKVSGYMPSDETLRKQLEDMIAKGVKFTDAEESASFREIVKKSNGVYPLESELSYLYMRSNVTSKGAEGLIAEMQRDMFRRLPKEWRNLDIRYKAIAAIMLNRAGDTALARMILESVRQFASYKPDKGMWFDRTPNDWLSPSPLFLTSQCLDAYLEVDPDNDAVAKLSQFLVLSRQTTDWNLELGQAGVACVVNSVVSSIKDSWIENSVGFDENLKILLNGKEIATPSRKEKLTGNFYLSLDASRVSGAELRIVRSGESPAWGGVLNQYIAPIRTVKAHDVPQLKITKALLPVDADSTGKKVSASSTRFVKGQRVRVTLTLETDRDLDYVMLSDQLGAWMQPAEQLTEYGIKDGLLMLIETRTARKNFYITRLPKGKYVLSYEVNADRDGEYSTGIAEAQSQYYPLITAHSAGAVVEIRP